LGDLSFYAKIELYIMEVIKAMDQPELDSFVEKLIDDKNIEGLTPEGRAQIAGELKDELVQQINRAILMELPDEKLDEIDKKLDSGEMKPEDLPGIVENSGVDVAKITMETLLYFKAFYLGKGEEINNEQ
jgi:hypothetical protein